MHNLYQKRAYFKYGVSNVNLNINNGSKKVIKVVSMDCTTLPNGSFNKSLSTYKFKKD